MRGDGRGGHVYVSVVVQGRAFHAASGKKFCDKVKGGGAPFPVLLSDFLSCFGLKRLKIISMEFGCYLRLQVTALRHCAFGFSGNRCIYLFFLICPCSTVSSWVVSIISSMKTHKNLPLLSPMVRVTSLDASRPGYSYRICTREAQGARTPMICFPMQAEGARSPEKRSHRSGSHVHELHQGTSPDCNAHKVSAGASRRD